MSIMCPFYQVMPGSQFILQLSLQTYHNLEKSKIFFSFYSGCDTPGKGPPNYKIESLTKYLEARNSFENSDDDMDDTG